MMGIERHVITIWLRFPGLRMMCFNCGKLGHPGQCPVIVAAAAMENQQKAAEDGLTSAPIAEAAGMQPMVQNAEDYGAWMLAQTRRPRRNPRQKTVNNGDNNGGNVGGNQGKVI